MTEGVVCPFELLSALAPSHLLTSPLRGAGGPPLEGGLCVSRVSAPMVGAEFLPSGLSRGPLTNLSVRSCGGICVHLIC